MVQRVVVAGGDQDAAGADAQAFAFDSVTLQELEVLLHFQFSLRVFAAIDLFGNCKNNEENC